MKCFDILPPLPPTPEGPPAEEPLAEEPPVPPPPEEPASFDEGPAKKKAKSLAGIDDNWQRYEFDEQLGYLIFNKGDDSITAHCRLHGSRCRAPKSLRKFPIGYCLAWPKAGKGIPKGAEHARAHMDLRQKLLGADTQAERQDARDLGSAIDSLQQAFLVEAMATFSHVEEIREPASVK